ncbi:MAG: potassium/proton antiporter [Lentisphaeria bacterium]|nr:potassium/proton antiporter [Lentisphaeria bacterium]
MEPHQILAVAGALLLLGVFSSKLSSRFNMPILLMFLAVGMTCGSDGLGWVSIGREQAPEITFLGTVAMCFILFSGGLDTSYKNIKPVLTPGIVLATAGVLVTALLLGLGAALIFDADLKSCLMLGAIVSSTDAAAVFAILRSKGVSLKGNLRGLLELESGSNDPMAAFLTIFMLSVVTGDTTSPWLFIPQLLAKMLIGVGTGALFGKAGAQVFNRLKLDYEGLYLVCSAALVIFAYGVAELCYGNGFMAVYVCGLFMGNLRYNYQKGINRFTDGLAWLMQVALFTALGLLVNPHELLDYRIWLGGIVLSLVLMFVARPAAVFLCTSFFNFSIREKTLISWVGLRGAAPIVLATFPLVKDVENAGLMFNMVFFLVLSSVILQGRTLMPMARWLKLDSPLNDRSRAPLELEHTDEISGETHEFDVTGNSSAIDKTLAELNLPHTVLVMLIRRNKKFILARGNTKIHLGDGMLMMGDRECLQEVASKFFPDDETFNK